MEVTPIWQGTSILQLLFIIAYMIANYKKNRYKSTVVSSTLAVAPGILLISLVVS